MRTRLILLGVPLLLFASSAVVKSDESEPGGGVTLLNEEERTVKRYSWQGIPVHDESVFKTVRAPRPRVLSLYGYEDSRPEVYYGKGWDMTGRIGPSNLLSSASLGDEIEEIVDVTWARHDATGLKVRGTNAEHERVAWLIEQLRAYYAQRINFTVFELDEPTDSGAIPAERARRLRTGAKLTATRTVRPRELALVSNVRTSAYTSDYDLLTATSASIPQPVMMKMNTGRELALSACASVGGGVIVRGMHGRSSLIRMRTYDGPAESGVFEQPEFDYEFEEGAVKLWDGQAWVFGDRHLVFAEIDKPFVEAVHSARGIRTRLFAPELYSTRWPNTLHAVPGDDSAHLYFGMGPPWYRKGVLQELEDYSHDAHWGEDVHHDAMTAIRAAEPYNVRRVGPLIWAMWYEEEASEASPQLGEPAAITLQVRRYLVGRDADLPDTLLRGAPDEAALEVLGEPDYSRRLSQIEDGVIEDSRLRLRNYVATFDATTATSVAVYDTEVATLVSGTRLRITLERDGPDGVAYDALFATAPPGTIKDSPAPGNKRGNVQTASIESTAVRLAGTLKVGESVSTITPSPAYEDQLIVLVITRVEP